jgi:antitoxin CcdA
VRAISRPDKPRPMPKVSLDPELLDQASEAGIDVTTNLNAFLRDQIRKARADRWLKENREALDDANAFLARHGLRSGV